MYTATFLYITLWPASDPLITTLQELHWPKRLQGGPVLKKCIKCKHSIWLDHCVIMTNSIDNNQHKNKLTNTYELKECCH